MKINLELIQRKLTKKLGRRATQKDIANLLGVSQVAISKMIKKDSNKALGMIYKASKTLKTPIDKLIIK